MTYTDHRDDSRARREDTPKWGDVSAHPGAVAWQLTKKGMASRAQKIRHLWDIRWHEEKRAVAQGTADLQQHRLPPRHILCEGPHYLRYASAIPSISTRPSPPGGPGTHPGPSGRPSTPPPPTPRRTGPTVDGPLDPDTPTPNPSSTRGLHPPSRSTDPSGHQHAGCNMHRTSVVPLPRSTGGLQH